MAKHIFARIRTWIFYPSQDLLHLGTTPHCLWLLGTIQRVHRDTVVRNRGGNSSAETSAPAAMIPCLPAITAAPTESLESFSYKVLSTLLRRVRPPRFFSLASARRARKSVDITDHFHLFSALLSKVTAALLSSIHN